jgi:hypothetical protein
LSGRGIGADRHDNAATDSACELFENRRGMGDLPIPYIDQAESVLHQSKDLTLKVHVRIETREAKWTRRAFNLRSTSALPLIAANDLRNL